MLTKRPRRLTYWTGAVGVALVALCLVPVEREPAGSFQVRPASRAEVRSPTSGFLREVRTDEAEAIRAGQVIAVLEIPDLATRTAQKESEIDARCAKLAACRAEWAFAKADCARAATLSPAKRLAAEKAARVWGDEVDNETAEIRHAREELGYLHALAEKCVVRSGISGVIVTPHLKERVGQFLKEGDLICEAQDPSTLLAEVKLAEQEVEHVRAGQTVRLRARALPFDAISGIVERVAPAAAPGDLQSTVTVYCRLTAAPPGLRAGMTGYARIQAGSRPLGQALAASILRFLRTEFWL